MQKYPTIASERPYLRLKFGFFPSSYLEKSKFFIMEACHSIFLAGKEAV